MAEFRCRECGKLILLDLTLVEGKARFYCRGCKHYYSITASTTMAQPSHLTKVPGSIIVGEKKTE